MSGCRCVEIDVWDGDEDTDSVSGDDASSSSSSDEGEKTGHRKKQDVSKTDGSTQSTKKTSRRKGISSKLGSLLGRKSSPQDGASDSPASTATAAALDAATQILRRPEPRVLHGHTLTKGTTFRNVCYAIRDSAFVASDLPVIVSLEVHACIEQQATMVEIMEEAWKGMLIEVTPELEATQAPPPLETLKRKILIKVKWVPATGDEAQKDDQTDALDTPPSLDRDGQPAPPKKPSKVLHSLSRLAVFTKGYSFRQFTQPGKPCTIPPVAEVDTSMPSWLLLYQRR